MSSSATTVERLRKGRLVLEVATDGLRRRPWVSVVRVLWADFAVALRTARALESVRRAYTRAARA